MTQEPTGCARGEWLARVMRGWRVQHLPSTCKCVTNSLGMCEHMGPPSWSVATHVSSFKARVGA